MTAFQEQIERVVVDFLETALVIDDDPTPLSRRITEVPRVAEQARETIRDATEFDLGTPSADAFQAEEQDHPLDAKSLTDAFADIGVVCSVIAPTRGSSIQTRFLAAAARADLVVLDWEIHRDGGETAKALLKAVRVQDAAAQRKRLRFVALYTGQDRLREKVEEIRVHLGLPESAILDDGMALMHDNLRIGAFNKPLAAPLSIVPNTRQVAEADLPRRLAAEFARLTDGLVPAVTLAALTTIRNDTHRVLLALSAGLDLGYLGHRAVSPYPEDAQGHLVDMVAAEIGSLLREADVGRWADMLAIDAWLERARGRDVPLESGTATDPAHDFTPQDVDKILRIGLSDDQLARHKKPQVLNEKKLKQIRKSAASLFTNDADEGDDSADKFSMRMAVSTMYSRPKRVLRLGTVVRYEGQYMVCVQPRCDSVRLGQAERRQFPFLPFQAAVQRDSQYEVVVACPDPVGGLVRLRLRTKPYLLTSFEFEGGPCGNVEACAGGEMWEFHDVSNRAFTWVAELKPEFAQRVAVNLAAELARVGLSESEQLRLSQD
jgi:hypothetical protein